MKLDEIVDSAAAGSQARKRASRALGTAQRECIALSDATDCLLEAYDCVARRAYEHFIARGPRPSGDLEDWLAAEREMLLGVTINVKEAAQFVYALAGIPGATAARLEVGIESRWLVILAQPSRPAQVRRDEAAPGAARSFDFDSAISRANTPGLELGGGMGARLKVLRAAKLRSDFSRRVEPSVDARRGTGPRVEDDRPALKSICILELPAAVDADRSIAVLSDGLLAIRMPKIDSRL